jgi:chemotaxis protein MotB
VRQPLGIRRAACFDGHSTPLPRAGAGATGPNTNRNLAQHGCATHEGKESMYRHSTRLLLAGMLLFTPGLTSCVSQRLHQQALEEKDTEIRTLREERSALKIQNQQLKTNYESVHGQLSEANARPVEELVVKPEPQAKIPELDEAGITYGMRDGNMVITIPSSITFASGQATLSKEGQGALKKVAALLKKEHGGARYSIEGHTDNEPIKKSKFETNRELSYARAMAVLQYMVSDCGIQDDDCVVVAHGQYEPLVAKGDKARNRRVEIVVHKH